MLIVWFHDFLIGVIHNTKPSLFYHYQRIIKNMAEKPNIKELQEMSGSDELHKCFKFLFSQEIPMNETMLMWLSERRDELRISIDKRSTRMNEVFDLNFDEEEATDATYESLREVQVMELRLLESFAAILKEVRALISKKEHAIATLDNYD